VARLRSLHSLSKVSCASAVYRRCKASSETQTPFKSYFSPTKLRGATQKSLLAAVRTSNWQHTCPPPIPTSVQVARCPRESSRWHAAQWNAAQQAVAGRPPRHRKPTSAVCNYNRNVASKWDADPAREAWFGCSKRNSQMHTRVCINMYQLPDTCFSG